ncbi:4173_t:CDS:2 [Acaulospora morrowiae]|uniref:4173_t:CDS:1 n=1 Tax=Acaulospora morrowiae TaxID=94023 RepID=A0A9N9ECM2_9GLOM|nr:4173_t:CDS:2 [Acaulospora morrowiae]
MPPLLLKLSEKRPVRLHYLGVSYGLTPSLHKFWKNSGFVPLYLRQTPNDLTGEHTCVMLKALKCDDLETTCDPEWLTAFSKDFHKRFLNLLSYKFRDFPSISALSIMEAADAGNRNKKDIKKVFEKNTLYTQFSTYDLKRLESYANNMLDYHVILDLIPLIANLYFGKKFDGDVKLSGVQSSILLGIGLQRKDIDDLEKELSLPSTQILALFIKIVRKISTYFRSLETAAMQEIPEETAVIKKKKAIKLMDGDVTPNSTLQDDRGEEEDAEASWDPVPKTLEDDLEEAGDNIMKQMREKQRELINSLDLSKYAITGSSQVWEEAESQISAVTSGKKNTSTVVSIKNTESANKRKSTETAADIVAQEAKKMKQAGGKKSHRKSKNKR